MNTKTHNIQVPKPPPGGFFRILITMPNENIADLQSAIYIAILFLLGIVLLGLWGYMYDKVDASKLKHIPRIDILYILYIAIKYLQQHWKSEKRKTIILFLFFLIIFVGAIIIAFHAK